MCRATIGVLFGEASGAGRGLRKADGVSAERGGRGFRRPPPPPPPPGPGSARNTRRGSVISTGAVSGVPEVSHSMVTTNKPCTRKDASVGNRPVRTANVVRSSVAKMLLSLAVVRERITRRASIPARAASLASKSPLPGRARIALETTTASTASRGTPAARAISSTVKTSVRTDIGSKASQANLLPRGDANIRA